jgi:hypothetical protein
MIVGTVDTPDDAKGVALSGTTAFVADWNAGLQVIDRDVACTLGGCCVDGNCVELIPGASCVALGGTFLGRASDCSGAACAPASCPADTNGDGAVDVDDLNTVIVGWGMCP